MAQAQALLIGLLAHADAELVALAGMHHALHVVEPAVDVALDDGFEVLLHLCARDLDVGGQRVVALGGIGADDGDLVILDLVHAAHGDQLAGHVLAAVELHLHVLLADDFALERGGEGHGDVDLLDLDLDAAQLQGLLDGHAVVGDGLQRARNGQIADGLIHHHREAQRDCARTGGNHDLIQRAEGVDEGRNALLGVGKQRRKIARGHAAEDQRRADGDGHDVDDCGHIVAQRHHAELQAHLHAALNRLIDHVADQEGEQALGLVVLDDVYCIGGIVRLAQHHGHAGDVAGDQRHAQGADDGIRHEANAALVLIGLCAVHKLETLQDLRAHGGGQARVQRVAQLGLVGNQALEHAHAGGQVAQLGHLHAGGGVDGREEVGGVREGDGSVRTVLGDGVVHRTLGQACNRVGTGKNQISQSAHRYSPHFIKSCLGRHVAMYLDPSGGHYNPCLTLYWNATEISREIQTF